MKDLARKCKDHDKKEAGKDPTSCVSYFDMEKVLIVSRGETSAFYYSWKFAVYNFTIYDCSRHDGFCYIQDKTVGKKGSNEISSFVLDYIGKMAEKGVEKLVFYSDNRGGQNRNRYGS